MLWFLRRVYLHIIDLLRDFRALVFMSSYLETVLIMLQSVKTFY